VVKNEFIAVGTCLLSRCLAKIGRKHIKTHRESRLTAEELLEVVFSLWSDSKLYKEDYSGIGSGKLLLVLASSVRMASEGSQGRASKPRLTLLTRTSSNLLYPTQPVVSEWQ
jgi:hypothetical protein